MDKAKDFEKGWEEYKAKKKQEVEEMYQDFLNFKFQNSSPETFSHKGLFDHLHRAGYRKVPDGGCVLDKGQNQNFAKFVMGEKAKARKETAEKFAERLKSLVAERNCNEDYDWEDVQIDGQIFVECIDEICKGLTGNV